MKKYEINPFSRWKTYELEAYLAKKTAQGWKLTDIFGKLLIFNRVEPSACEYAVRLFTPKTIRQIEEYQELCEGSGWKPITWTDNLQIMEKMNPSAIALDTDEELLLTEGKKILFDCVWRGLLATLIAFIFYLVITIYAGDILFDTLSLLLVLFGVIYLVSKIADIIQCFVWLNRVKKEMRMKSEFSIINRVWNICYVWYRRIIITLQGILYLAIFVEAVFMDIKGGLYFVKNERSFFIMMIILIIIMLMITIKGNGRVYHARKVEFPLWVRGIYLLIYYCLILFMSGVANSPAENIYTPDMWGYSTTTKDYSSAKYEGGLIGNRGEYDYAGYGLMEGDSISEQHTSAYELKIYNSRINGLLDSIKRKETKNCTLTYLYELRGVKVFQLDGYLSGYEKLGIKMGYEKYYYLEYEDGFCIFIYQKYVGDITNEQVIAGLVDKLNKKVN